MPHEEDVPMLLHIGSMTAYKDVAHALCILHTIQ